MKHPAIETLHQPKTGRQLALDEALSLYHGARRIHEDADAELSKNLVRQFGAAAGDHRYDVTRKGWDDATRAAGDTQRWASESQSRAWDKYVSLRESPLQEADYQADPLSQSLIAPFEGINEDIGRELAPRIPVLQPITAQVQGLNPEAWDFIPPLRTIAEQNRRARRPSFIRKPRVQNGGQWYDVARFEVGHIGASELYLDVFYKVEAYGSQPDARGQAEAVAFAHPESITLLFRAYEGVETLVDILDERFDKAPGIWQAAIRGWAISPEDLGWTREELVDLIRERDDR